MDKKTPGCNEEILRWSMIGNGQKAIVLRLGSCQGLWCVVAKSEGELAFW